MRRADGSFGGDGGGVEIPEFGLSTVHTPFQTYHKTAAIYTSGITALTCW